jgi:hypothetical protein
MEKPPIDEQGFCTPFATRSWQKQHLRCHFVGQSGAFTGYSFVFKKNLQQKCFSLINFSYLCSRKESWDTREGFFLPLKTQATYSYY